MPLADGPSDSENLFMAYTSDTANSGSGGPAFNVDRVAGVDTPVAKMAHGVEGTITPVTAAAPLPTVAAATDTLAGAVIETAPATDTASSGLNGRLQRIAQRLTSMIALLPTALGGNGGLKVEGVASGTALPTSIASGGVASGAVASGAFASGALASGSVASGAFASGSIADGAQVTLGAKADAKSSATDTTSITVMQVLKQLSAEMQLLRTALGSTALDLGVSTGGSRTLRVAVDTTQVQATVAHDAADSGDPLKIGGRARSSEIAAVSNNDRADLITDLVGKLIVLPYANPENFVSGAITSAMTGTTSTSLVAAPASGLRNYITQITVSNASITVPTDILIQDGSGGTTLYVLPCPAGAGTGTGASGATFTFPTPLRQPTTATALFCANVTTGSSTKVSASGYKGV